MWIIAGDLTKQSFTWSIVRKGICSTSSKKVKSTTILSLQASLYALLTYCISAGSSLSEVLVWSALAQLTSALMYCHYGVCTSWDGSIPVSYPTEEWDPVIHRDIKPANGSPFACSPLVSRADFGSPCEQQYKRLYLGQAWRFWSVQSHG